MASMSTVYGPGSVTTETSAPTSGLGGGPSFVPDSSLFAKLAAAALAERRRKQELEERRQREADQMTRERHQLEMRAAQESQQNAANDRARLLSTAPKPDVAVPQKWITELVPTGYGHMLQRRLNPAYEKWAAQHGQMDAGPDSVNFAPSPAPGGSAAEPFISRPQADTQGDRSFMPADEERADFFGTGTTNRKQQAATMLANAQSREEEAAVDAYLRTAGLT